MRSKTCSVIAARMAHGLASSSCLPALPSPPRRRKRRRLPRRLRTDVRLAASIVVLLILFLAVAALSQTAPLTGVVRDSSGAAVAGASVRLARGDQTTTDTAGAF